MGGRGTYASGNNVPFTYEPIGKIAGVKILKGLKACQLKRIRVGHIFNFTPMVLSKCIVNSTIL